MTALTGPMRAALYRLPSPEAAPQVRPRGVHRATMARLLAAGLIEEVSPGLYRMTPHGLATLKTALRERHDRIMADG